MTASEAMPEHQQAAAWRESMGLTQQKLGELLGYAKATVYWMERGLTAPRRGRKSEPVPTHVWQRYRRACQGLDAETRTQQIFQWQPWSKP